MAWLTYNAPEGDDKVVEYMGVEMFHGVPVDLDDIGLDDEQKARVLAKAVDNPFFELSDEKPSRRGRRTASEGTSAEEA